jgi:hypothetical protein
MGDHDQMRRRTTKTRLGAAVTVLAAAGAAVSLLVFAGGTHVASAAADFQGLGLVGGGIQPSDPAYQEIARTPDGIEAAAARKLLTDAGGTIWIAPTTSGDVCLVWDPSTAATTIPGWPGLVLGPGVSCAHPAQATTQGVFIGVPGPGRWEYGVAPDGMNVVATVNGTPSPLAVTNGAFHVPPEATRVTVGTTTTNLPRPVGTRPN